MFRQRGRTGVVVLVVAAIVGIAWLVPWGAGSPAAVERAPERAAWEDAFERLDRRATAVDQESAADRATAVVRSVPLTGRVLEDDTSRPIAATVFVHALHESAEKLLTRGEADLDGFRLDVPVPAEGKGLDVHVGAFAPGRLGTVIAVTLGRDGADDVEIRLTRGQSLRGRIVKRDDTPVEDLPLYIACGNLPVSVATRQTFAKEDLLLGTSTSPYHESRVRTAHDGSFEAWGLGPGKYRVFSLDPAWFIVHRERFVPGDTPALAVAVPALFIEGKVRHGDTPVPRFHVEATVRSHSLPPYSVSGVGLDGEIYLSWKPQKDEHLTGVAVEVVIDARGYQAARDSGRVPAGTRRAAFDFALRPQGQGGITIHLVDSTGAPVDLELRADLADRFNPSRVVTQLEAVLIEPGRYRLDAPEGKWFARLYPAGPVGKEVAWMGEILVGDAKTHSVWAALPAHGTVVLRWDPDQIRREHVRVVIRSEDGKSGGIFSFAARSGEAKLRGFPPGAWTFALFSGDATERQVLVRAHAATTVDWR